MGCIIIIKNNFKRSFHKKTGFLMNLLLPILVVMLGIAANHVSRPSFILGVIGEDTSQNYKNVVNVLQNTEGITIDKANAETIKVDTITGKYAAIVEFTGDEFEIYSVKDETTISSLDNLIKTYIKNPEPLEIEEIIGTAMSISKRTVGFIVLFLMITSTITASLIIKDKNNGTLKRYKYSPQKAGTYILGNFMYNFSITYFQYFISVSLMTILNISIGISYPNLLLMGLWATALATSFGNCIATLFRREMYATLFSTAAALVLSLIGGTFIAFEYMPKLLQYISVISPLRWFIDATANMDQGINWFSNIQIICIISVMIFVLLVISIFINKKNRVVTFSPDQ